MSAESTIRRRRFLGGVLGSAAAAALTMSGTRAAAGESGSDDWIKEVKGSHRCLFDFPQHKNGYGLLHILNYLNTYSTVYKTAPGEVGAVGTFYSAGNQASIPLAFNDAMSPVSEARTAPPWRSFSSTGSTSSNGVPDSPCSTPW